jgi:hypothetical protein
MIVLTTSGGMMSAGSAFLRNPLYIWPFHSNIRLSRRTNSVLLVPRASIFTAHRLRIQRHAGYTRRPEMTKPPKINLTTYRVPVPYLNRAAFNHVAELRLYGPT